MSNYSIPALIECADQLRCHPASRGIRDIEAAGEMLRWAAGKVHECGAGAGCCAQAAKIEQLEVALQTQRAGVRAVIDAAVALVCAPGWAGISDEDVALEQALRSAELVTPNDGGEQR